MVYAIVIIAIIAVAAGVGITLSKRKKIAPLISAQVQTTSDETQFWVCPHCGKDTEYRNQKQFCISCNVYL